MIVKNADLYEILWDESAGPIENILALAEYGLMFLPGMRIATILMAALGLGPKQFGAFLDNTLNLKSLDDLLNLDVYKAANVVVGEGEEEEQSKTGSLKKKALNPRSIRRVTRRIGRSPGLVRSLVGFLSGLVSAAKKIAVGGLGVASLQHIRNKDKGKDDGSILNILDTNSTKEKANQVKSNLEDAVNKAFSL